MSEWGDFELSVQEHNVDCVLKLFEAFKIKFDRYYALPDSLSGRFEDPYIPVELINALRAFRIDFEIYVNQEYEDGEDLICHIKCEYSTGKEIVLINKQKLFQDKQLVTFDL